MCVYVCVCVHIYIKKLNRPFQNLPDQNYLKCWQLPSSVLFRNSLSLFQQHVYSTGSSTTSLVTASYGYLDSTYIYIYICIKNVNKGCCCCC